MERFFLRPLLSFFSLFLVCNFSSAQDLTGIWKGYFITDVGEQYKLEFQIKQDNPSSVTGVSYSYLDVRFYGKATMTGSMDRSDKKFQIQELRTVEVKSLGGGGTCLMKYIFTYDKSGKEEFLEGTFVGKSEDRRDPKNNGEWGDCGGGKVYLRRVQNSDFYVEPFLRDKPVVKKDTSAKVTTSPPPLVNKTTPKTNPTTKKTTSATKKATSTTKKTTTPVKQNTTTVKTKPVIINPKTDSTKKITQPDIKNPVTAKKIITPEVLRTRENALAQTITVNTEQVTIKLYDNGEIDDDSISVFVDKQLKLSHKRLSTSPIVLTLDFDASDTEHEVVMVAENLGRIPPNTSLMVITAGDKRYQVQITSTEQKNAMVRFKYESPSP
ncbi:MAG TPA: hypothetical protein VFD24_06415 [Chitinophagaceae bacterium]|jgi:hypothetical protein|nr:hypothetical protein [Chitinophagaceae bacterium]